MPTITGLTERQVMLLDIMWSIDSTEQYNEWLESQDAKEIATLEELMLLSASEETQLDNMQDATKVLNNIMNI